MHRFIDLTQLIVTTIPFILTQKLIKTNIYSHLVLASSTKNTSLIKNWGDRLSTLYAVLSKVLQCSLWKGTTTLTVGKDSIYSLLWQPRWRMSGRDLFRGILSLRAPLKPFTEYNSFSSSASLLGKWAGWPCSPIP